MMKKINPIIAASIIIGLSAVLCVLLFRDIQLRNLAFEAYKQQKIDECIQGVKQRYSQAASAGKGILNFNEVIALKTQDNAEEDRCITRYK